MDHLLDGGCIWEVKHDRHCGESQSKVTLSTYIQANISTTSLSTIECLLTSVGHEDFHSSVLQQVTSGKDGTDLREQPFSMKTFCIRKNLGEQIEKQKVGYIWFNKEEAAVRRNSG